ncbi:MAG: NnrU family protein [Oleiphilaceae bacterium]|nr:NnrU family protein [Oleiphilaceae bacterium]
MLYPAALLLFFLVHLIPLNRLWRERFVAQWGERRYRAMFRIVIILIVVMGVYGWSDFPNVYFYEPPLYLKHLHIALMLPVVYLWVAAEVPNNLKRVVRHPMLTGMKLWAIGHLLANGDLRSMILFVSFLLFSILAVVISNRRGAWVKPAKQPLKYDVGVIAASVLLYVLLLHFHGHLFGMPVVQYFSV